VPREAGSVLSRMLDAKMLHIMLNARAAAATSSHREL